MKWIRTPTPIEATQWFKNGDHPMDDVYRPYEDNGEIPITPREGKIVRYYRTPSFQSNIPDCRQCGEPMNKHGWIDGQGDGTIVCPGDYVVGGRGQKFYTVKPYLFEQTHTKVED